MSKTLEQRITDRILVLESEIESLDETQLDYITAKLIRTMQIDTLQNMLREHKQQ